MVIRLVFILILLSAVSFAGTCINCHKEHYAEIGTCASCHRGGDDRSSRENIAHAGLITSIYADFTMNTGGSVNNGQRIADKANCRRCHTIGNKGNRLAFSLSESASKSSGEFLKESIEKPNEFMPDFRLKTADTIDTVKYLLSSSDTKTDNIRKPYVVYIQKQEDIFDKKCGGCIRH